MYVVCTNNVYENGAVFSHSLWLKEKEVLGLMMSPGKFQHQTVRIFFFHTNLKLCDNFIFKNTSGIKKSAYKLLLI